MSIDASSFRSDFASNRGLKGFTSRMADLSTDEIFLVQHDSTSGLPKTVASV
jgi:hypothetical protein